jgi:putative membrane protein
VTNSWLRMMSDWDIPIGMSCALVVVSSIYVIGWRALKKTRPAAVPRWRLVSFLAGMFSLFVAVASPLDTFSQSLLFMHMAQHFVLMCVAPPLIVMGSPQVPLLRGLPRVVILGPVGWLIRSSIVERMRGPLSRVSVTWFAMNVTYICWHIPRAYEFALSSEGWHEFEHLCFFVTSVIFWWPVVVPWPSYRWFSSWILIPYLLLSDLLNTGVSAFLCFSGRLLYPSYARIERPFGIDALKDQIAAGAFMWVFGSLVFMVPAIFLTVRILNGGNLDAISTRRNNALAR